MEKNVFEELKKESWAIGFIERKGKEMLENRHFVKRLACSVMAIKNWDYVTYEPKDEAVKIAEEFIVKMAEERI